MHEISSYRGNRPTNTHPQTGLITIHCTTTSLARSLTTTAFGFSLNYHSRDYPRLGQLPVSLWRLPVKICKWCPSCHPTSVSQSSEKVQLIRHKRNQTIRQDIQFCCRANQQRQTAFSPASRQRWMETEKHQFVTALLVWEAKINTNNIQLDHIDFHWPYTYTHISDAAKRTRKYQ